MDSDFTDFLFYTTTGKAGKVQLFKIMREAESRVGGPSMQQKRKGEKRSLVGVVTV